MRLRGEGRNIPGAPGSFNPGGGLGGPVNPIPGMLGGPASPPLSMLGGPNTTGSPVGYNPLNQIQTGIVPGDPMSQIGNQGAIAHHMNPNVTAGGNVTAEGLGKARENQYNQTGQPIGTGWGEPSGEELQQIIERMKLEGQNQSSNIPTAMPQSGTAFPVGNMNPLIAQAPAGQQTQRSNLLNPLDWFSGRNQQTVDEVEKGTYKGGKGGAVDKIFKTRSDTINAMREAGML